MTEERSYDGRIGSFLLPPEQASSLSRRRFIELAAGTAFMFGFYVPARGPALAAQRASFAPNAFIRIDRQGNITLIMPQVEMGQGTYTSISMLMAEELDADWSRVAVEHAPPDEKNYANPDVTIQATGNSNSIRAWWKPLRQAGASTRACFVEAAAQSWGVPAGECRTENSAVIHDRTGRKVSYGALVDSAAAIEPQKKAPLKSIDAFRLI